MRIETMELMVVTKLSGNGTAFGVNDNQENIFINGRLAKEFEVGDICKAVCVPNRVDQADRTPWQAIKISLKEDALVFPTIDLNTANGFSSVLYKNGAELGVKTGIKNHLHLEGEGISLNDFPFSTGAGSPSNAEFGTYVGSVFFNSLVLQLLQGKCSR